MARMRMTTAQVQQRLKDPARWTLQERKAAIKALQGSVNRAYDRLTKEYGIHNYATAAIEKRGRVKNWSDLENLSYRQQMAEIRRAVEMSQYKTLTKSDFDRYIKVTADRLSGPTGGPGGQARPLNKLYDTLTPDEQSAFWRMYDKITNTPDFLNSVFSSMDSERVQRWVYDYFDQGYTVQNFQNLINAMNQQTIEKEPPAGVSFDPMDLL